MEIELAIAGITLLLLAVLATIDMAFSQLSDVSLRRLAGESEEEQKRRSSDFLREILESRARFRFTISSVIQFLLIVFTVLVTLAVNRVAPDRVVMIAGALIAALVLSVFFRQILPRLIVWNNPEGKLLLLLPLVRPVYLIVSLFVEPFARRMRAKDQMKLETTVTPDSSDDRGDDNDDLQALMEVGEAEGIIEEQERELIETMVEFSETRAGEIMTPRTELCALAIDATVRQARDLIIEEKYSRIPVYRDNIDNVEGILYVRDLLNAWSDGKEDMRIESMLRAPFFVPETKSAADLLKSMQSEHVQIAVVIDEYGGVAGVVTVEDIIEEIVGEIEDEDIEDEEIIEIIEGEDGYFDVLGSTEIDKIERIIDLEIYDDDDFTTIAGLVTSELGYVPKPDEKLELRGLSIEILQADDKRISLLRIRKSAEQDES